jgi:hypothetical protein
MAKTRKPRPKAAFDRVAGVYVNHPLDGTWAEMPPLSYVTEDELRSVNLDAWMSLEGHKRRYREGEALSLLGAVIVAHDAGLYPPMWALDALATAFRRYYEQQGKKRLDDVLRLNRGRGKDWFKETVIRDMNQWLAQQMFKLRTCFKVTMDEAAEMLQAKLEEDPITNNSIWKIDTTYNAETLKLQYRKKWRRAFNLDEKNIQHLLHPDNPQDPWTAEMRQQYLHVFPRYAWPSRLKLLP